MANQFDVTPADPLGALNTWQGDLATTALKQAQASREQSLATEEKDKVVDTHDKLLASQAFREAVTKVDPAMEPMKKLEALSNAALSTGQFSEAEKALAGMAHLATVSTQADLKKAQEQKAAADANEKKMKRAMELMQGVEDEDSKRMADSIFEAEFKEPSPFAGVPYSAGLKKVATGTLNDALTKAKIRAEDALTDQRRTVIEKDKLLGKAQAALDDARREAIQSKNADLKKSGGSLATASAQEKKTAAAVLKDFYPNLKGADMATEEVSQEAKAMLARREAPDYSSAVKKIIAENPGRFKEEDKDGIGGLFGGKQTTYSSRPGGKDAPSAQPKPLPPKGQTPVIGQAYTNSAGVTKTWTAEGWK